MKITVINGTEQKGCTFSMKELFLSAMGEGHCVTEFFLPRDCPVFCTGCKACFFSDIKSCPHSRYTVPVWESILSADLLVFTSPAYVFHVTAQMKALLDHYGTKWIAHSPEKPLFSKQAVIITNAIGQGMGKAAAAIKDSLDYWGVARTYIVKQALFQAKWENVSPGRKKAINDQCKIIAKKIVRKKKVVPCLKVRLIFHLMKIAQKMIDKAELKAGREHSKDYLYWKENGWIDGKKPWKIS